MWKEGIQTPIHRFYQPGLSHILPLNLETYSTGIKTDCHLESENKSPSETLKIWQIWKIGGGRVTWPDQVEILKNHLEMAKIILSVPCVEIYNRGAFWWNWKTNVRLVRRFSFPKGFSAECTQPFGRMCICVCVFELTGVLIFLGFLSRICLLSERAAKEPKRLLWGEPCGLQRKRVKFLNLKASGN